MRDVPTSSNTLLSMIPGFRLRRRCSSAPAWRHSSSLDARHEIPFIKTMKPYIIFGMLYYIIYIYISYILHTVYSIYIYYTYDTYERELSFLATPLCCGLNHCNATPKFSASKTQCFKESWQQTLSNKEKTSTPFKMYIYNDKSVSLM